MMIDKHMGIQSSSRKTPTNTKSEVGTLFTSTQNKKTTTLKIKVFLALRLFLNLGFTVASSIDSQVYGDSNEKPSDFITF